MNYVWGILENLAASAIWGSLAIVAWIYQEKRVRRLEADVARTKVHHDELGREHQEIGEMHRWLIARCERADASLQEAQRAVERAHLRQK